jgi:cysteine desulfurase
VFPDCTFLDNSRNADSRTHDYGENARKVVDNSRQQIANLLEAKKD